MPQPMREPLASAEHLWRDLLDVDAVDQREIEEFRAALRTRTWRPLGAILVKEGFVSVKQMSRLLNLQLDEPELRLGDLAVREGCCTADDLERALEIQRESCPGPMDLVADLTAGGDDRIVPALVRYAKRLESYLTTLVAE